MEHVRVFDARPIINKITTLTTLRKKGYYQEYKVFKKTQIISLDYIYIYTQVEKKKGSA